MRRIAPEMCAVLNNLCRPYGATVVTGVLAGAWVVVLAGVLLAGAPAELEVVSDEFSDLAPAAESELLVDSTWPDPVAEVAEVADAEDLVRLSVL